jgi:hypothetical protein
MFAVDKMGLGTHAYDMRTLANGHASAVKAEAGERTQSWLEAFYETPEDGVLRHVRAPPFMRSLSCLRELYGGHGGRSVAIIDSFYGRRASSAAPHSTFG